MKWPWQWSWDIHIGPRDPGVPRPRFVVVKVVGTHRPYTRADYRFGRPWYFVIQDRWRPSLDGTIAGPRYPSPMAAQEIADRLNDETAAEVPPGRQHLRS